MSSLQLKLALHMKQFLISTLIFAIVTTTTNAQEGPKEVSRLIAALTSIAGVTEVQLDKTYLPDVKVSDLTLPGSYADLPIAAMRRTNGALPEELLLSIDFRIQRNESGLKALEFISWWVRDQSRGGENMQIRSIGLPPMIANAKQLGTTLRFTIDWFYSNPSQDMKRVLDQLAEKAKSLETSITLYKEAF